MTKKKWSFKTYDLLKEVQNIWIIVIQDKNKAPVNTGHCLIEAGLTVYHEVIDEHSGKFDYTKEVTKSRNFKKAYDKMSKWKGTKIKTMMDKTQHTELNVGQHESD